jgi:hypothetical protein
MSRFILLGGVLAMLAGGAIALAFKIPKQAAAQHQAALVAAPEPVDPAILTTHLEKLRREGALP